jgi:hypothetical protein
MTKTEMEPVAQKYDPESGNYYVAFKKPGFWRTGPGRYTVDIHGVNSLKARGAGQAGRKIGVGMKDVWFGSSKSALKTVISATRGK